MNKKILLIIIPISLLILVSVTIWNDSSQSKSIFDGTKEITHDDFEFTDIPPKISDNKKLDILENNDEEFIKANKIIQGLNSTNIEDDDYWQKVIDSLMIVNEKLGENITLSFEESEQFRDLLRQEKLRQLESGDPPAAIISPQCDSSYPDICLPSAANLNCSDIPYTNFKVIGNDPHGFDRDNDGIGCES